MPGVETPIAQEPTAPPGLVVAPRTTRFVASVLTAVTASDFLQIAYKASEERL